MTTSPLVRWILFAIGMVLMLGLAWTGITGGLEQLPGAHSSGQKIQSALQLAYGALSIPCIATLFWVRTWNRPLLLCWTVALALAGGLGATVWGETSVPVGALAGVSAGLIGAGIAWLLRFGAGLSTNRRGGSLPP